MYATIDPAKMTDEQRTSEVAAILAAGFLRHRRRKLPELAQNSQTGRDMPANSGPKDSSKTIRNCLEGPRGPLPHVPAG